MGMMWLREQGGGHWLGFEKAEAIFIARSPAEVKGVLEEAERALAKESLYVAGFLSYEAASGLDPALQTKEENDDFPMIYLGLYQAPSRHRDLPPPLQLQPPPPLSWEATLSQEDYTQAIRSIHTLLQRGESYQVNFTYRLQTPFAADPYAFFFSLVQAHDPPYGGFIEETRWAICSASPEVFFSLDGSDILSKPMKGTSARGLFDEDDQRRAAALQASPKERAENVMIVDMVRNDLSRIAHRGSVQTTALYALERYPTLWQMTSTVEAKTDAPLSALFQALFPPASITGAPKARTMQIIAAHEATPRRIYTGSLGYISPQRKALFNVAIRTLLLDKQKQRAEYGVGGGITIASHPEDEWKETQLKAKILQRTPERFALLETMLWLPHDGIVLREEHRERLLDSAAYFAYPLHASALDHALDTLCERLHALPSQQPQRIRLTLDHKGKLLLTEEPFSIPAPCPLASHLRVALAPTPIYAQDPLLYHKTTQRQIYEKARQSRPDLDDIILYNQDGHLTETTLANLALDLDGTLYTPPLASGLLNGCLRRYLLRQKLLQERVLERHDLLRAQAIYRFNSLRGFQSLTLVD